MPRTIKRYLLWIFYAVFLALAVLYGGREPFFTTGSPFVAGKYLLLIVFLAFVGYSLHATRRENFFKSVVKINRFYWGRQIGLDLYISVFMSLALIYFHEGSLAVMMLWLLPVLVFANLAILPYIILNYGSIVNLFQS